MKYKEFRLYNGNYGIVLFNYQIKIVKKLFQIIYPDENPEDPEKIVLFLEDLVLSYMEHFFCCCIVLPFSLWLLVMIRVCKNEKSNT